MYWARAAGRYGSVDLLESLVVLQYAVEPAHHQCRLYYHLCGMVLRHKRRQTHGIAAGKYHRGIVGEHPPVVVDFTCHATHDTGRDGPRGVGAP